MKRVLRDSIADLAAIVAGIWFLMDDSFADLRGTLTEAIAVGVMGYAALRIILRLRAKS